MGILMSVPKVSTLSQVPGCISQLDVGPHPARIATWHLELCLDQRYTDTTNDRTDRPAHDDTAYYLPDGGADRDADGGAHGGADKNANNTPTTAPTTASPPRGFFS